MESLGPISREERQKRVQFAVGMAAIDGGKPTDFTRGGIETIRKWRGFGKAFKTSDY